MVRDTIYQFIGVVGITILICTIVFGPIYYFDNDNIVEGYHFYKDHEVYRVIAPFGIIWTKGRAVFLSGTQFDMNEKYVIKYLDGNELKTVIQSAEEVSIVIDGTLKLSEYRYMQYNRNTGEILDENYLDAKQFQLYIPALPEMNQTLTLDWEIER